MSCAGGVGGSSDACRSDRPGSASDVDATDAVGSAVSAAEADSLADESAEVPDERAAAEAERLSAEVDVVEAQPEEPSVLAAAAEYLGQTAKGYATGGLNTVLDTANLVNAGVNAGLAAVGSDFRFATDMGIDPTSDAERHAQNAVELAAIATGVAGIAKSAPAIARGLDDLGNLTRRSAPVGAGAAAAVRVGDLTADEMVQIQAAANRLGDDIYVVGSAARGERRHVGSDLPLARFGGGKDGTRSDIDYAVRLDLDDAANRLSLPDVDPSFGVRGLDYLNLDSGPAIRFSPNRAPAYVEGTGRHWLTEPR